MAGSAYSQKYAVSVLPGAVCKLERNRFHVSVLLRVFQPAGWMMRSTWPLALLAGEATAVGEYVASGSKESSPWPLKTPPLSAPVVTHFCPFPMCVCGGGGLSSQRRLHHPAAFQTNKPRKGGLSCPPQQSAEAAFQQFKMVCSGCHFKGQ